MTGSGREPDPVAATPDGNGFWTVDPSGRVAQFGTAGHHGDAARLPLSAPIVGIASTRSGRGYWLVGADGGVFAFGDAHFYGSAAAAASGSGARASAILPVAGGYAVVIWRPTVATPGAAQ